jgi:spore germination cell wall hydrolase CwlJ-like protein
MGVFMLAVGSSAAAQDLSKLNVSATVRALDVDASAKALGTAPATASTLIKPAVATTTVVAAPNGSVFQAQPAQSVTIRPAPVATEAAWLFKAGWPLYALVDRFSAGSPLDQEANCLATAVYFEARGETLEGQLAVAKVVINRAKSGKYPSSWCAVMKQPWQFSFVNPYSGQYPAIDQGSRAWAKAQGVARLAASGVIPSVADDVLWYHATYVAPSWGRRLSLAQRIGTHIFYRA